MNGGPASTSGVFLRGANSDQTLVLIDGLRVGSSTSGTTALEAIPLDQIDRIEILRGPASSLYGADAIGGVIQVFTRHGGDAFAAQCQRRLRHLRHQRRIGRRFRQRRRAARTRCEVGHRQSAGFNAIVNPANFSYNPDRDGYRGDERLGAASALRLAPEQELSAQYLRQPAQRAVRRRARTSTIARSPPSRAMAVASRNRLAAVLDVSGSTAGEGIDDISDSRTGFGTCRSRRTQRQYVWQNDFALPRGALGAALERREERVGDRCRVSRSPRATPIRPSASTSSPTARTRCRRNLRRDDSDPVRRPDDRRARLRLPLRAGLARDRGLQHRLQGAVVQRPLLSGLFQSEPRARDRAQRRGRRLLERVSDARWPPRASPIATGCAT